MKNTLRFFITVSIVGSMILLNTGCHKDKASLPVVTTADVSGISLASVIGGGTITDDGGESISESGVCWSTSENPTINDSIAVDQTGNVDFEVNVTGLKWATTYYLRAYATNSVGTAYGNSVSFTTSTPNALVYIDSSNGDDKVEEALAAQRCNVTIVTDGSDFATKIATGSYNLAVLFSQGNSTPGSITTDILSTYIATGGLMVYATFDSGSGGNYAALFNAGFTGNVNLSTVTLNDAMMIAKAGTTSFTITNAGWGTYSTGLSATTGGTVLAAFENGEAAMILGNAGHTMMLGYLSDAPSSNRQEIFESVLMKLNDSM